MAHKKVRVAIIGVGNCASSLVQGVQFYKNAKKDDVIPGIMHTQLADYHVRDIEFTIGIDVNVEKVGKDLSEAIFAEPNNTYKFADVPHLNVPVVRGMTHDGLGKYLSGIIHKAPGPTADIVKLLRETKTDVVVNFLPVGSEMATKWYVEQVIEAGCAFVNGIPVFIASSEYWGKRFADAGLPILGDDIKSQVGATILHRQLATLFVEVLNAHGSAHGRERVQQARAGRVHSDAQCAHLAGGGQHLDLVTPALLLHRQDLTAGLAADLLRRLGSGRGTATLAGQPHLPRRGGDAIAGPCQGGEGKQD